jgi:hypothetical protein
MSRPCDTCGAPAPEELERALEPFADRGTLIHNCRHGDEGWMMAVLNIRQEEP